MENIIYKILCLKENELTQSYDIEHKLAKTNKNYLFIKPKNQALPEAYLAINKKAHVVIDYHLSIYEDLQLEEKSLKSSYHLTIGLQDEKAEQKFKARIYYTGLNKVVLFSVKDAQDRKITEFNDDTLNQLAKFYSTDFSNTLNKFYLKLHQEFNEKYNSLIEELSTISRILPNDNTDNEGAFNTYDQQLDKIMELVSRWERYQISRKNSKLPLFIDLKKHTSRQLVHGIDIPVIPQPVQAEISEAIIEQADDNEYRFKQPLSDEQKLKILKSKLDENKKETNIHKKIVNSYKLHRQIFKLSSNNDEALDSFLECRNLEKEACSQLQKCIILGSEITQDDLEKLIKILPAIETELFMFAVKNNRSSILKSLLQAASDFDIDMPFGSRKRTLLEIAYKEKHKSCFAILLDHGAFADKPNDKGRTLLMKSCHNKERKDEMISLLKAGASTLLTSPEGFSPFGFLTMRTVEYEGRYFNMKPDIEHVQSFLDNAKGFIIDYLQGPAYKKSPPLVFICENGWLDIAKLLLEYGADPRIMKEVGKHNSLDTAVLDRNAELCQLILDYAKQDLSLTINSTLFLAEWLQAKHGGGYADTINIIKNYMQKHDISQDSQLTGCIIPVNCTDPVQYIKDAKRADQLRFFAATMARQQPASIPRSEDTHSFKKEPRK